MGVKKPELSEFLSGLYKPEFVPDNLDLNTFVQPVGPEPEVTDQGEVVVEAPVQRVVDGVPVPLTEAEAQAADQKVSELISRIGEMKTRIGSIRSSIDTMTRPQSQGAEMSFQVKVEKKAALRRALKRLFGRKTNVITYTMYLEALEIRRKLEKTESTDYVKGFDE